MPEGGGGERADARPSAGGGTGAADVAGGGAPDRRYGPRGGGSVGGGPRRTPGAPAGEAVLALDDAVKRYGSTVGVDGVTLHVTPGERVALAGPSGAGKTTLLRLMNGSLAPTAGQVRIFGRDPARVPAGELRDLQRRIGTVHQGFHLVDNLRVVHNVNAGNLGRWSLLRAMISLVRPRELERATRLLDRVGIADKRFERTGDLSGGERQRVALARVLAQDPDVILADEPIASLDRENSREVMELLAALSREGGKTLVVSVHEIGYALRHCQRVVGIRGGRVAFDAPAGDVTDEMVDGLYRLGR